MHFYIILSESFCNANKGYKRDNLSFGYSITKSGQYVTSVNSLNEFPELFSSIGLEIMPISRDQFQESQPKTAPTAEEIIPPVAPEEIVPIDG